LFLFPSSRSDFPFFHAPRLSARAHPISAPRGVPDENLRSSALPLPPPRPFRDAGQRRENTRPTGNEILLPFRFRSPFTSYASMIFRRWRSIIAIRRSSRIAANDCHDCVLSFSPFVLLIGRFLSFFSFLIVTSLRDSDDYWISDKWQIVIG